MCPLDYSFFMTKSASCLQISLCHSSNNIITNKNITHKMYNGDFYFLSQAYESEVRARHKSGMAKDMEDLMINFAGGSGSAPAASTYQFGAPAVPLLLSSVAKKKPIKITKAKPLKTKKTVKPLKVAKTKKQVKPTKVVKKVTKKIAATEKSTKKTAPKKIKGHVIKKIPKKKFFVKKVETRPNFFSI